VEIGKGSSGWRSGKGSYEWRLVKGREARRMNV
jgi:hypothetical protein